MTIKTCDDAELVSAILGKNLVERIRSSGLSLIDVVRTGGEGLELTRGQKEKLSALSEAHRRLSNGIRLPREPLVNPEVIFKIFGPRLAANENESFWVLPLDIRNQLIGSPLKVSMGGVSGCDADGKIVFVPVLRLGASAIVAIHNHPTGDASPSPQDLAVTRNLVRYGKAIDVELLDHIIIGTGYVSIRRDFPECFALTEETRPQRAAVSW